MKSFISTTSIMKPLILAVLFFASCSPQKKAVVSAGGYTDPGTVYIDKTVSKKFVAIQPKKKKKKNPGKYYAKSKPFFSRGGINGQLQLYKY